MEVVTSGEWRNARKGVAGRALPRLMSQGTGDDDMTTIDLASIRRAKRGQTPTANLPRRSFYFVGDDIYYHASTGEWARAIHDDEVDESPVVGFMLAAPPVREEPVAYDFAEAIRICSLMDEDEEGSSAEEAMQQMAIVDAADAFEAAPSGHFACVIGSSSWGVVLAVGPSPDEASANALVAEQEQDPSIDVVGLHATMRSRGSLSVRPITRAALSAYREDGQDCRFRITDEGRVDVATDSDDWSVEVN